MYIDINFRGINFKKDEITQIEKELNLKPSFDEQIDELYKDVENFIDDYLGEILSWQYPDIIFLPDHKDRKTFINGVQTNNGKHNLLLCQLRSRLKIARDKLKKSNYYSFWTEDYLKEILNH